MSQWHREHPHLVGTSADPWMQHGSYRSAMTQVDLDCPECGDYTRLTAEGICRKCALGDAA